MEAPVICDFIPGHPGPIYEKKDTKTWSCQLSPSPRGLLLMILLCTLPGVSAQPVAACQESDQVSCTLRSMGFMLLNALCHFRS